MTEQSNGDRSQPALRYERWPLAELQLDPRNARAHDRPNIDAIKESLQRFGQRLPVVVRGGQLVGGNATTIAADELGWTHLDVAVSDDLSVEEARRLAIMLNRSAELATWDNPILLDTLQGFDTLEGTGFSPDDLAELESLLTPEPKPGGGLTDPDAIPEPPEEAVTRPGDLWLLGPHRLLCGDARQPDDVQRLLNGQPADCMWTDPPYGVSYVGKTKDAMTIRNDDAAGIRGLLDAAFTNATPALQPGAAIYVAHPAGALSLEFRLAFDHAGWRFHQTLVWVKDVFVLGHSDYHYQHEPILYGYTPGEGRRGRGGSGWYGGHDQTSVFFIARPKQSEEHPIIKPVDLITPALINSCPLSGTVLDLFGGYGSTILAAHQTNRVARLLELDSTYCDRTLRRFQEHTGIKPILEATGEPYDFTSAGSLTS